MRYIYILHEQHGWVKWGDCIFRFIWPSLTVLGKGTPFLHCGGNICWPTSMALRDQPLGAHVCGLFVGAVYYADSINKDSYAKNGKLCCSGWSSWWYHHWEVGYGTGCFRKSSSNHQEIMKALNIHNTALYGSSLWDLYGVKAMKVFSTWNTTVQPGLILWPNFPSSSTVSEGMRAGRWRCCPGTGPGTLDLSQGRTSSISWI